MPELSFYIVSITAIISLIFYKKFKNTKYIYFIYYLLFTFIIELLGFLLGSVFNLNMDYILNIYIVITFIFYFIFYRSIFKNNIIKKTIFLFIILYLSFILFDLIILRTNFINQLFINNMVFGSILLLITLLLFLIEIINSKDIVFNIKKAFIFWISIGALLFYIGIIPIMISGYYLEFDGLFDTILTILNLIMYGCFTIGFIKSDPKYNY